MNAHVNGAGVHKTSGTLELPPVMESVLRPHQVSALEFIWKRLVLDGALRQAARTFSSTIEQRTRLYQEVYGVILAHSMGLGKTLTSLSFVLLFQSQIHTMLMKRERVLQQQQKQGGGTSPTLKGAVCPVLRVLVLCPRSCVLHWQSSISEWMQPRYAGTIKVNVHIPSAMGPHSATNRGCGRSIEEALLAYYQQGGILLLGYEEYQRLLQYAHTQLRSNTGTTWPRVWSLLDRIRLHLPLIQDVRLLDILGTADLIILDEAHRLRRTSSNLVTALTQHIRNIQLRLALTGTPLQNHLEEYNTMQSIITGRELDTQLFQKHFIAPIERGQCMDSTYAQFLEMQRSVASLRKYFADSAHHCGPEVLEATLPPRREFLFFFRLSALQESAYKTMLNNFFKQIGSREKGDSVLQLHHTASHICLHPALSEWGTPAEARVDLEGAMPKEAVDDGDEDDDDGAPPAEATSSPVPPASLTSLDLSESPKLSFAVNLTLYIVRELREKVVIFSQYLSHLRLMAELLAGHDIVAPSLTGTASDAERRRCIMELQSNESCRVLLCSVRAGGVGIKLTGANHCILLDVSWNPADDVQATYRLYRYGQLRPVTIYRLATWGTSENVVFAYALQKSWLQKKISSISDPHRQQRHQTRSYFRYPCGVPLPDHTPLDASEELPLNSNLQGITGGACPQDRVSSALQVCERQCPAAAQILNANPEIMAHLYTVIPQSVLLRHNDEDVIRDRERRFEEVARKARQAIAIPLQLYEKEGVTNSAAPEKQSLLDVCEAELVDAARQAAHLLIARALHARAEVLGEGKDLSDPQHQRSGGAVAEARSFDQRMCEKLQPLFLAAGGQRPPPRLMVEVLLLSYQAGSMELLRTLLQGGAYLKLRTYLISRVPSAVRRHPRGAALPSRSPLEEALLFSPVSLLNSMPPTESTYVTTELGCDRPLIGFCILRGLEKLWHAKGRPALSVRALRELALLLSIPGDTVGRSSDSESDSDGEVNDDAQAAADATIVSDDVTTSLSSSVLSFFVECLEEQWPPCEGLALPTQYLQLDREEMRMARAYSAATTAQVEGLLPLTQVADLLRLPSYRHGQHMFGCARCSNPLLYRMDPTHLECPRCHYNAEFEIRVDPRTQQQTALYQLSVVANLLDAFSITKSFGVSFSPAKCADVSAALREVRTSHAAFEFVRRIMEEGVRVFLNEYPTDLVRLLGLQMGVGGDVEELGRVLKANGRLAAHTNVREHVRQKLAQSFAEFVHPSTLHQLAAVPLLFLVTALHHLARCEELTYAHELLLDEYPTPRRKLLRFASDALVKVLYVERLLAHCRQKPQNSSPPSDTATVPQRTSSHVATDSIAVGPEPPNAAASLTSLMMTSSSSERSRCSSASSLSASLSDAERQEGGEENGIHNGLAPHPKLPAYILSSSGSASDTSSSPLSGSSSSSFCSVYSDDRESFPDESDVDKEGEGESPYGPQDSGTWLEALVRNTLGPTTPTAEQLESEAVQQQRSAQYWIVFCEVYGTHSAETLTVYIEDGANGVKALSPPPLSLWVSQVAHTTLVGYRITDMLDLFLTKLLELSQQVRVIN